MSFFENVLASFSFILISSKTIQSSNSIARDRTGEQGSRGADRQFVTWLMPWLYVKWNYFKIISEDYCSSWIFSNMFNVAETILKSFPNSFRGWNNFISVSGAVTCEITYWNNFEVISKYFTCNHGLKLTDRNA